MFNELERQSQQPEIVFELFDPIKTGLNNANDFKRCIKIFFGNVVPEGEKMDFVMKLTKTTIDGKIKYREFCKLLSKKFVKTFKLASKDADDFEGVGQTKKSSTDIALERPLVKEASLNYIMRKAAEL
jgi:Ca2+-binding EF-hand superfamily protein